MAEDKGVKNDTLGDVIKRVMGEEFRSARQRLGLSQPELVARMFADLHPKALASYEQGVRPCTAVRLFDIAWASGSTPAEIVIRTQRRVEIELGGTAIYVDLWKLAEEKRPEFRELRRWARARLAEVPGVSLARLAPDTLREMALIWEITPAELSRQFAMFTPDPAGEQAGD